MPSIAYPKPPPIPVPLGQQCPASCDLSQTVICWLRRHRELLSGLAAARGSDDAEVLRADLRAAEGQIDALIEFGRWAA